MKEKRNTEIGFLLMNIIGTSNGLTEQNSTEKIILKNGLSITGVCNLIAIVANRAVMGAITS